MARYLMRACFAVIALSAAWAVFQCDPGHHNNTVLPLFLSCDELPVKKLNRKSFENPVILFYYETRKMERNSFSYGRNSNCKKTQDKKSGELKMLPDSRNKQVCRLRHGGLGL